MTDQYTPDASLQQSRGAHARWEQAVEQAKSLADGTAPINNRNRPNNLPNRGLPGTSQNSAPRPESDVEARWRQAVAKAEQLTGSPANNRTGRNDVARSQPDQPAQPLAEVSEAEYEAMADRLVAVSQSRGITSEALALGVEMIENADPGHELPADSFTDQPIHLNGYVIQHPAATFSRSDPQLEAATRAAKLLGISQETFDEFLNAYVGE